MSDDANDSSTDKTSNSGKECSEAPAEVPDIGKGRRWYDYPYRLLCWLGTPPRRKLLPKALNNFIWKKINDLTPYNEYDRYVALPHKSSIHSLQVPSDEHVRTLGIWVIELFPPSYYGRLTTSMKANGWRQLEAREIDGTDNATMVRTARAARNYRWWRLGGSVSLESRWIPPDAIKESVPDPFISVELRAVQVGSGLTAVIAFFCPLECGAISLDSEWHAAHEPVLSKSKGRRPHAYDRCWAGMRATQQRRADLQDSAREWLSAKCPGAFADMGKRHPVLEMMLLDKANPAEDDLTTGDPYTYRALGLTNFEHIISPEMPGFSFILNSNSLNSNCLHDCHALIGNKELVLAGISDRVALYGGNLIQALPHIYDDAIGYYLLINGLNAYSDEMVERSASKRDAISQSFKKYGVRAIVRLRRSVLTESLDIAEVSTCYKIPWDKQWRVWSGGINLTGCYRTGSGLNSYDFAKSLLDRTSDNFNYLAEEDKTYRNLLGTASSLGSSVSATRLGRIALLVAFVSMAVAVLALLLSDVSGQSLFSMILSQLSNQ